MDTETTGQPKTPGIAGMIGKILIVALLAAAVAGVVALKQRPAPPDGKEAAGQKMEHEQKPAPAQAALPRLVDLGATKCVPCKMMAPILEELKKEQAGKLEVVFIDVWEKPEEADAYGVKMIPTQIFFDAAGKERFRHEGFFSKEDILAKWRELGVKLGGADAVKDGG